MSERASRCTDSPSLEGRGRGLGPDESAAGWIAVGRIIGAFGVRGQVKVVPTGRSPERFRQLERLYVGETHVCYEIEHCQVRRTEALLKLKGIDTREAAVAQRYVYVYVPESEAIELPPGEYFVHQIVGLQVHTTAGEHLGAVEEVLSTGANDVYVVPGPRGEVLIPALKTVIRTIDLASGQLIVELPPGLLATAKQPTTRRRRRRGRGR